MPQGLMVCTSRGGASRPRNDRGLKRRPGKTRLHSTYEQDSVGDDRSAHGGLFSP